MTAQEKISKLQEVLTSGGTVDIITYTRVTRLHRKHVNMIKASGDSMFVQNGRNWDCIDFCKIRAYY